MKGREDESAPTSVKDVAEWLLADVQTVTSAGKWCYQQSVARRIRDAFGDEWVYKNPNGNLAIDQRVLRAWRKLSGWGVGFSWNRSYQAWVPIKPSA